MKFKGFALVVVLAVGGGWLLWASRQRDAGADLARELAARASLADDDPLGYATQRPSRWDLDELTATGRGMPLPDGLVSRKVTTNSPTLERIADAEYWFIGKHEDGGGVEIPFAPGRMPQMTDSLRPIHENPGYVGPTACRDCHAKYYESFMQTAHARTSQAVTSETIAGQFGADANRMRTSDPQVSMEMIRRGDQYLQRVSFHEWKFDVPMQLIMGSSKMAQSYLYWHDDGLFQHNVTHLTEHDQWINSPGYIDGDAAYARPVPQRCMDCHTTYFDFREPPNHYTPQSLILGVTCERCHGPAESHVAYHREHPDHKPGHAIVVPSKLTRQQSLDVCGQCHAGAASLSGPAMRYRPGDALADFYHPPADAADALNSVHTSNQLTRLAASKCFESSQMTCVDCHNPHQSERGQKELFSQRCLTCHQVDSCGLHPHESFDLASNCIDCHMPIRPTEKLRLESVQGDVFPSLRDHLIRVDDQATRAVLAGQR